MQGERVVLSEEEDRWDLQRYSTRLEMKRELVWISLEVEMRCSQAAVGMEARVSEAGCG